MKRNYNLEMPISSDNKSIIKDYKKCMTCGYCSKVCPVREAAFKSFKKFPNRDIICVNCGQCANICPNESIKERMSYIKVLNLLKNKQSKKIVFSIAPAVRVAIAEEFGNKVGINVAGKVVTALKKIGADYVFDIAFGADLTVMEEAMEFVDRIKNNKVLPQFTSCCPAWVKYVEIFEPKMFPNLSTAKSPIAMQGTIIKTYLAEKIGVKSKDIINVVVAPCTAKKMEIEQSVINYTKKDTDYILTTRELALLLKTESIDLLKLKDSEFDSPLGISSSAGLIFGSSGGVLEASLRTAYYFMTGKNLKKEELVFSSLRGMNSIKQASIEIEGKTYNVAVCNGLESAKVLIKKIKNKECDFSFIEVMNCTGGCIAGGGQPKIPVLDMAEVKQSRMDALYSEDEKQTLRLCHENPSIKKIYSEFLGQPNSDKAHELLHRKFEDMSYLKEGVNL